MNHEFFWRDLMTSDPEAALEFYGKVIGWTHQVMPAPKGGDAAAMPYTVLSAGGVGVAGMMQIPPNMTEAHPCWLAYVKVDDVAATVAAIQAAGGVLHRPPTTVEGVIEFAVVADPQGAVFLVARPIPSGPMPDLPPRTQGTVGWHELYADDWQTDFAFYETVFGWTKSEAHDMGPMGVYQLFRTGGAEDAGGMMNRPPQVPVSFWNIYFHVDAIGAAAERVKAAGGRVMMGPHQVPTGDWIVQCMDPQGAVFALMSDKA
jgi:predicted enzyme related to lactoylglutathione lyase